MPKSDRGGFDLEHLVAPRLDRGSEDAVHETHDIGVAPDTPCRHVGMRVLSPEEQATELSNSYIARLEDGFRIVYVGRFEESGVAILGS